jgi:hypothetical protein
VTKQFSCATKPLFAFQADVRKLRLVINLPTKRTTETQKIAGNAAMFFRISCFRIGPVAIVASVILASSAQAQVRSPRFPDPRGEFVRQCAPHMMGRWAHPEAVCGCLHDYAAATIEDNDLRDALLRGISETGVPTIETDWVPPSKQSEIGATFTKIAKPTLQCMFEPSK